MLRTKRKYIDIGRAMRRSRRAVHDAHEGLHGDNKAKYYHLFSLPACWHLVEWPHWLLYNVCMLRSCELACQGASLNFSLCQIREALWHAARKRSLYWHCRQWIVVMIPNYTYTQQWRPLTVADITSCQFDNKNTLQCCYKQSHGYW